MSLSLNGAFWPTILPLFHGSRLTALALDPMMDSHQVEGLQECAGRCLADNLRQGGGPAGRLPNVSFPVQPRTITAGQERVLVKGPGRGRPVNDRLECAAHAGGGPNRCSET